MITITPLGEDSVMRRSRARRAGPGRPIFVDPRGGSRYEGGWEPPAVPDDPVQAMLEENARLGVGPEV